MQRKKVNMRGSELIMEKSVTMYLKRSNKVPLWNYHNCLYAITILSFTLLIGQAVCSDSNNYNSESYASNQRRIPSSGSGSGTLEKRSSYAVLSDIMSGTVNSEFGSEYRSATMIILHTFQKGKRRPFSFIFVF